MIDWYKYYLNPTKLSLADLRHGVAQLGGLPLYKTDSNLISPSKSIAEWVNHIDRKDLSGMMKAFRNPTRSELFKEKQTSSEAARFSGLVPLVLSAFKEYANIPYSKWDWRDPAIKHLLDPTFVELIPYIIGEKDLPQFEKSELIEILNSLDKPLTSYWQITDKIAPVLSGYPRLLKVQLLQTWVAHPSVRNQYMLLDCTSLDKMPEPLLGDLNIFENDPFTLNIDKEEASDSPPWFQ